MQLSYCRVGDVMVKDTTKPGSEEKEISKRGLKTEEIIEKATKPKVEEKSKKCIGFQTDIRNPLQSVSNSKLKTQQEVVEKKATQVPKIDLTKKIIELHNDGLTTSKIGLILRSEYKILNVKKYCGKTITLILDENKLTQEIPEDLSALLKRAVKLIKHMKSNTKDMTSKYGYQKTVSKIRRLSKYYKRTRKLPKGWIYSEEQASILVK